MSLNTIQFHRVSDLQESVLPHNSPPSFLEILVLVRYSSCQVVLRYVYNTPWTNDSLTIGVLLNVCTSWMLYCCTPRSLRLRTAIWSQVTPRSRQPRTKQHVTLCLGLPCYPAMLSTNRLWQSAGSHQDHTLHEKHQLYSLIEACPLHDSCTVSRCLAGIFLYRRLPSSSLRDGHEVRLST